MSAGDVTILRITDEFSSHELLERVGDHRGSELIIDLSEQAQVLASASDFKMLAEAARESGVRIRVETSEPVRLELARIYGLADENQIARRGPSGSQALADAPTRQTTIEPPSERDVDIADSTTEPIDEALPDEALPEEGSDSSAGDFEHDSFSFVINPPVPRRPDLAESQPWDRTKRRTARQKRRVASVLVIGLAIVLFGVALLLAGVVAPWMRVSATPATAPMAVEVTYGVAGSTDGLDVAIEPREISRTIEFEVTVPATGVRVVADGTASGVVQLTNSSTSEQSVPSGTYFPGPGEVGFVSTEDVVVPAADPFGTLTFGSATVAVVADQAGIDGNVAEGEIAGQLDDDLFFTNRNATSGGTVQEISVVDESDIARAMERSTAELDQESLAALRAELRDGEELLDGSFQAGEVQHDVSHEAGQDATEVTVRSRLEVRGQAIDLRAIHEAGQQAIHERTAVAVPPEHALKAGSLTIAIPETIDGSSGPAFRLRAEGTLTRLIDDDKLDELRSQLVGATPSEIDTILSRWGEVEEISIERGPSWLPWDPPVRLASRVEIEVEQPETESP